VLSLICPVARAAGNQHTLRLLPDFLIPRCVIRLDYLVKAAAAEEPETNIEHTCRLLGCIDERTARTHLKRVNQAVATAAVHLARRRAMRPELGELSETSPETIALARLEVLYRNETEAALRAGGCIAPISLRQILQAALWKPSRKKPSAFAFAGPRPP
jgi:hypothetical protein